MPMPAASASAELVIRDRLALDQDLAGVRRIGAEQHVHQRRLAGAVLAQQPEDFAGATLRSTASFAWTAPKLLVMPRISMSGAGTGDGSLADPH